MQSTKHFCAASPLGSRGGSNLFQEVLSPRSLQGDTKEDAKQAKKAKKAKLSEVTKVSEALPSVMAQVGNKELAQVGRPVKKALYKEHPDVSAMSDKVIPCLTSSLDSVWLAGRIMGSTPPR